jgi:hypothetical protein
MYLFLVYGFYHYHCIVNRNFLFFGMIGTLVDIIIPRPDENGDWIPGVGKVFSPVLLYAIFWVSA